MPRFIVSATVNYIGWVYVEADSEDEALSEARDRDARDFEVDTGTAYVTFTVSPAVEAA